MMLSMVFVMVIMSQAPLRRCYEILQEEPNLTSPENAVEEVSDGSIDFENVSFRYSRKAKRPALQDVNLHIPSGATVGILGSTGLLQGTLVQPDSQGLYDVTEGSVKVGGIDVKDYDLEVLRDKWPWCCKRTPCSPAPSRKTCAGAMPTPRMKNWSTPVSCLRRESSPPSRMATTPTSSRAAATFPAARAAAVHCPCPAEKA